MLNSTEIMDTIHMIDQQHLDIRTITMGISLLDCCDPDAGAACRKIYDKICRRAEKLVSTGEAMSGSSAFPSSTSAFPSPPSLWWRAHR